jgi:hypothetical protein
MSKLKDDVQLVDVSHVYSYWMLGLHLYRFVDHELIGVVRRSCDLCRSVQTQNKEIQNQTVELEDERSKLKTLDDSIEIGMIHVFEVNYDIIFGGHVVRDIVVNNQSQ